MRFIEEYEDQYKDCSWVDFGFLRTLMLDVLVAAGVPGDDATTVSDVLIEADKRGIDSHGIGRLKPIYIDRIRDGILNPITKIDVVRERKTTAVVDGNNGMGHVVAKKAMSMAIQKAKEHGLGMTAVRNSTHFGIAGYYSLMATEQGLIGITGTNARPSIAPTFGVENMLGTNPLTIGFPTDEPFPFLLDCASSITQRGKIEHYERWGKELPPGWVIDAQGRTTTNATQTLIDLVKGRAALTPLGGIGEDLSGHKGYGYATVVEVLSSALQDGAYLKMLSGFDEAGTKIPIPLGHFFIAISVEEFTDLERFKQTAGEILRGLRSSRKAPGHDYIFTAGEKEYLIWNLRRSKGCPVPRSLQRDLTTMRNWYDLPHKFTWD